MSFPHGEGLNYRAWQAAILEESTFLDLSQEGRWQYYLDFGVLAASTHNTQPWLVSLEDDDAVLVVRPNLERRLPIADPLNRNLYISLGCMAANMMVVAARHSKVITYSLREGNNGPEICLQESSDNLDTDLGGLSECISLRFSDKGRYFDTKIQQETLGGLADLAQQHDVSVGWATTAEDRDKIAYIYTTAASRYADKPEFRQELARWLRLNTTSSETGMPGFVSGLPLIASIIGKVFLPRVPKMMHVQAAKDGEKVRQGPVLGLFVTEQSEVEDWVHVGIAYQLLCLKAVEQRLSITPMTAPIEFVDACQDLLSCFGVNFTSRRQLVPQFMFRMGYSENAETHTPRERVKIR